MPHFRQHRIVRLVGVLRSRDQIMVLYTTMTWSNAAIVNRESCFMIGCMLEFFHCGQASNILRWNSIRFVMASDPNDILIFLYDHLHWSYPCAISFPFLLPNHHPLSLLKIPRCGLLRWTMALRRVWSLSTAAKARLAASPVAKSWRKRWPSGKFDKALAWAATVGSEVIDPGTLIPLPNTKTSGG